MSTMVECVNLKGKTGCKSLNITRCLGSKCVFIKGYKEITKSNIKSFKRLSSLKLEDQLYIAEKYYGGKMPWKGGEIII